MRLSHHQDEAVRVPQSRANARIQLMIIRPMSTTRYS